MRTTTLTGIDNNRGQQADDKARHMKHTHKMNPGLLLVARMKPARYMRN